VKTSNLASEELSYMIYLVGSSFSRYVDRSVYYWRFVRTTRDLFQNLG